MLVVLLSFMTSFLFCIDVANSVTDLQCLYIWYRRQLQFLLGRKCIRIHRYLLWLILEVVSCELYLRLVGAFDRLCSLSWVYISHWETFGRKVGIFHLFPWHFKYLSSILFLVVTSLSCLKCVLTCKYQNFPSALWNGFMICMTGSGRFLLWLAKKNAESGNYLGLEIRQKVCFFELLLTVSNSLDHSSAFFFFCLMYFRFLCSWSSVLTFGLTSWDFLTRNLLHSTKILENIFLAFWILCWFNFFDIYIYLLWMCFRHFIFANAMVSFDHLISSYRGPLEFVSILVKCEKLWTSTSLYLSCADPSSCFDVLIKRSVRTHISRNAITRDVLCKSLW